MEKTTEGLLTDIKDFFMSMFNRILQAIDGLVDNFKLQAAEMIPMSPLVIGAINRSDWAVLSRTNIQVPEGLHGSLLNYLTLLSKEGMELQKELSNQLTQLNIALQARMVGQLVDVAKRRQEQQGLGLLMTRFNTLYAGMIKDNGLSHQPLIAVASTKTELIDWYVATDKLGIPITKEVVSNWAKFFKSVGVTIDDYIAFTHTHSTETAVAKELVNIAYELAGYTSIVTTVALGLQQNRQTANLFGRQLVE